MLLVYGLTFLQTFFLLFPLAKCMNDSIGDTFRQCLISQSPGNLGQCLGVGAISRLRSLDSSAEFDLVDGLTLTRDAQEYREAYNFEGNPANLRGIIDSFSYVFSKRNLKWNMGFLYPGLLMHIAPSGHPGGTLEFVVDPHREAINAHTLKEVGTGRLLARQFLLPLLLGFKFNVVSIIPVLFGVLALIAKKALVISKIALVASSAFALGTLLFGSSGYGQGYPSQHYTTGQYGHFGGHGGHASHGGHSGHGVLGGGHFGHQGHGVFHGYTKYSGEDEDYPDTLLRETNRPTMDQLTVFPNVVTSPDSSSRVDITKGRNFAWSDAEKEKKPKEI